MTPARKTETWLAAALALLALALAGVLWWEWQQGQALERGFARWRKIPDTPVPALALQPEFALPDAQTGFPEFLARPIFVDGRRAAAETGQSAPSAMTRGQFVLVGVVLSPTHNAALLRDVATGKTDTVAQGAQIRGLTLGDVAADKVVLRLGADTEELPLRLQTGASPGPGPAQAFGPGPGPGPGSMPPGVPVGAQEAAAVRRAAANAAAAAAAANAAGPAAGQPPVRPSLPPGSAPLPATK